MKRFLIFLFWKCSTCYLFAFIKNIVEDNILAFMSQLLHCVLQYKISTTRYGLRVGLTRQSEKKTDSLIDRYIMYQFHHKSCQNSGMWFRSTLSPEIILSWNFYTDLKNILLTELIKSFVSTPRKWNLLVVFCNYFNMLREVITNLVLFIYLKLEYFSTLAIINFIFPVGKISKTVVVYILFICVGSIMVYVLSFNIYYI